MCPSVCRSVRRCGGISGPHEIFVFESVGASPRSLLVYFRQSKCTVIHLSEYKVLIGVLHKKLLGATGF